MDGDTLKLTSSTFYDTKMWLLAIVAIDQVVMLSLIGCKMDITTSKATDLCQ